MTGRWSCVVLVLALAACRTPQKNVSVYSLADDGPGGVRHLQTGSDISKTVTGRMNLQNYTGTKTATNATVATEPDANSSPPVETELLDTGKLPVKSVTQKETIHLKLGGLPPPDTSPMAEVELPVAGKLPVTSTVQKETIHLKPGELPPQVAQTNATVRLDILGHHSPQGGVPVSQPIHLNLSAWTNSSAREVDGLSNLNVARSPAPACRQQSTSMNVAVNSTGNLSAAPGLVRAVALPAVGPVTPSAVEGASQPVDLEPLLDGAHDEAWRQRQADRQRAAENARQLERDSLAKTLQQFLQPVTK